MEKLSGPTGVRSYSDFMRSLAAKYNNNEYLPPVTATSSSAPPTVVPTPIKPDPSSPLFPFLAGLPPGFSSLQAGLSQLQAVAGFPHGFPPLLQQQLQAGAQSRPHPSETQKRTREDPLDLTEKRVKLEHDHHQENMSTGSKSPSPSPDKEGTQKPISPPTSPSISSTPPDPTILSWTVDQVANFVAEIEICKEYKQVFLDNKLDGGCLPMLTESHLTTGLGMKLGPALKLLTALRKALGPDLAAPRSGCNHCAHCHDQQQDQPDQEN